MQLSLNMYTAYIIILNHSQCTYCGYIYTWRGSFFAFSPNPFAPIAAPPSSPLYSLSLTWRPPAVTGTVLPLIRLLVD